jgi:gliding-associated putative ABC transporter substrate-binding component GldG
MKKNKILLSLLLIFGVVALLNYLNDKLHFRADFTADKRYTLSKATRDILKNIDEPITITAYFSDNLPPDVAKTKQDFEDILSEYNSVSNGMVNFDFINPSGDEEKESQAAKDGIQPILINVREKNEAKQQKAYMGAVLQYQNKKEILPFIQPGAAMEYSLSMSIKKMTVTDRPKIAIIQGFGCTSTQNLQAAVNALSVTYTVVPLYLSDTSSLADYKAVAIVAPKDSLPEYFFAQLDKYLATGGNLFIAYDHVVGDLQNNPPMGKSITTGMETWLNKKGITVENNLVIDAQCGSVSVQQGNFPFPVQMQFPYLPVITKFADHPITKGLENVVMQFASSINFTGGTNVEFTPLAMTSVKSATVAAPVYFDVSKQWNETDFPLSNITVMGLLSGKIVGDANSRIVIAGDGDFPTVNSQQQGAEMSDNVSLMTNSIDFLSDDTGLIGLRTKGVSSHPIDQMEDSTKTFLQWFNFLLPILLVVIYGIVRMNMNRRKRLKRMEENYVR